MRRGTGVITKKGRTTGKCRKCGYEVDVSVATGRLLRHYVPWGDNPKVSSPCRGEGRVPA